MLWKSLNYSKIRVRQKPSKLIVWFSSQKTLREFVKNSKTVAHRIRRTTVLKGYQISTVFTNLCAQVIQPTHMYSVLAVSVRTFSRFDRMFLGLCGDSLPSPHRKVRPIQQQLYAFLRFNGLCRCFFFVLFSLFFAPSSFSSSRMRIHLLRSA